MARGLPTHWRIIATVAVPLLAWSAAPAQAQDTAPLKQSASAPTKQKVVTHHTIDTASGPLRYEATVGPMPLADESGTTKAEFVYTAYSKEPVDPARPLTFAFNGGPGAASAYLHFGALGPYRVLLNEDGTAPPAPAQTAPNPHSWLSFTDLVFVDPVGTGRSRPAEVDGKPAPMREFWSVEADVTWAARFIRQYLSEAGRWPSPKFLVGESYGGFRIARLADVLPERFGIALNGLVLVSPLLDYGLSLGSDRFHLWPAVLRVPSFAAAAWHHGQAGEAPRSAERRDRFLAEVERFALAEMLPALAQGSSLPPAQRDDLYARLARYTGLPAELIQRADGRVGREVFIKRILRQEGKVVGRYDASVAVADPEPAAPHFSDADPTLERLSAPLLTATNAYLQRVLNVRAEEPYVLLNRRAAGEWNWRAGHGGAAVGAASQLRSAMITNPAMQVLIVHGRFDLVTPYFVSVYVADQMHRETPLRRNVEVRLYEGGHMMYFKDAVREPLWRDARTFYDGVAPRRN